MCALIDKEGAIIEWVQYSAYGTPFGIPGADADADFDCDSDDADAIQDIIDASGYDILADVDLDNDVDGTDKTTAQSSKYVDQTLGRAKMSSHGNARGLANYEWAGNEQSSYQVRHRALHSVAGRWFQRDPLVYIDGFNLYEYAKGRTLARIDPYGTNSIALGLTLAGACCQNVLRDGVRRLIASGQITKPEDAAGMLGCFGGKGIACVYPDHLRRWIARSGLPLGQAGLNAVVQCALAHEMCHVAQCDTYDCCADREDCTAPNAGGPQAGHLANQAFEKKCYCEETRCLESYLFCSPDEMITGACSSAFGHFSGDPESYQIVRRRHRFVSNKCRTL